MFCACIAAYLFLDQPLDLTLLVIQGTLLKVVAVVVPATIIINFIYAIKLTESTIYGYRNSGVRTSCEWSDITYVKLKRCLFIPYLYLYNEDQYLMVIPYRLMGKQAEFEEAILEFISADHPLREFLTYNEPEKHKRWFLRDDVIAGYFSKHEKQDVFYPWGAAFSSYLVSPEEKKKIISKIEWTNLFGIVFIFGCCFAHLALYNDSANSFWTLSLSFVVYVLIRLKLMKTWVKDLIPCKLAEVENDHIEPAFKFYALILVWSYFTLFFAWRHDPGHPWVWLTAVICTVFYGGVASYFYLKHRKYLSSKNREETQLV